MESSSAPTAARLIGPPSADMNSGVRPQYSLIRRRPRTAGRRRAGFGRAALCDGLARDEQGRLFFGAFDQGSLVRRNLDGSFTLIARDERLGWPDALFVHNGYLYVTLGQWNRMASLNGGKELRID
jgi:sugar lactone lactonase YvrE